MLHPPQIKGVVHMEKAKVNKEQATALDTISALILAGSVTKRSLTHDYFNKRLGGDWKSLQSLDFDTFIKALYSGYEIELTPEEKLLTIYENHDDCTDYYDSGFRSGVEAVLDAYNIIVKGIND